MEASTEISPRMMIHLTAMGQQEKVMSLNFAWLCATCYLCELRCPRGLDIPKIIEAIRQVKLRSNENFIEPFEIEAVEELPQIAMVSAFRKHTA